MYYKIQVYENPFDDEPVVSKGTDDVRHAEALVRELTERAQAIINVQSDSFWDRPSPQDVYGATGIGMK